MTTSRVHFYDNHPVLESLREAVLAGLDEDPKLIPPKFFYDARGSQLFDAICEQPEYYLPTAECAILEQNAGEIAELIGPDRLLIEPGAGSGHKVRLFLEALRPAAYVPMDISGDHLLQSARALAEEYPWLEIHAACVDYSHAMELPDDLPKVARVAFFPGSSLGNFDPAEAVVFLRNIADLVGLDGALLIGIDTKKDPGTLDAAYNDAAGITAAFNRNLLIRINRELNADFDVQRFAHDAFYNARQGRIEMHLVSQSKQRVQVDGQRFEFSEGERIHTENSYKYTPPEFQALARRAGFQSVKYWLDPKELFSVHYLIRHTSPEAV